MRVSVCLHLSSFLKKGTSGQVPAQDVVATWSNVIVMPSTPGTKKLPADNPAAYCLADIARHVIQRTLHLRLVHCIAPYGVASNICQVLPLPPPPPCSQACPGSTS